jgi:DnaJ-domain-containing protein 1
MLRKISTWFDQEETLEQNKNHQKCDHTECQNEGLYKAPKNSRAISNHHDLSQWYWFCKEHVRDYNAKWNFYKNMDQHQAYQSYKNDLIWNRPSWSVNANNDQHFSSKNIHDPFGVFNGESNHFSHYLSMQEKEALAYFNLTYPFAFEDLQTSYRNLVKKHHPDIHQTQDSEEQIRKINHAYQILKKLIRTPELKEKSC